MNDRDQQVESKLASLRPTKPSAELIDRIAQRAMEQQPVVVANQRNFGRQTSPTWAACVGLAVVLLVALTIWFSVPADKTDLADPGTGTEGDPKVVVSENDNDESPELFDLVPREIDTALPTAGNYLNALRDSPETCDLLLQKHADNLMLPTSNPTINELAKEISS